MQMIRGYFAGFCEKNLRQLVKKGGNLCVCVFVGEVPQK